MIKAMDVPAIVLIDPKYPHNVGAAIRACSCFAVHSFVWTGERVNPSKYSRLPREERMKGYKHVDFRNHDRPFDLLPKSCVPVCVEVYDNSEPLTTFDHPENAVYVFGPEDGYGPQPIRKLCHRFVHIPSRHCLNLSTAVAVVLAHRRMWRQLHGKEPILPLTEQLREHRGAVKLTPALDSMGWDGK